MIKPYPEHQSPVLELADDLLVATQSCLNDPKCLTDKDDVAYLLSMIKVLKEEIGVLVQEVSRERWNNRAASDVHVQTILDELEKPDSNVRLFPVVSRPIGGGV